MANKLYTGVVGTATITGTGNYTGISNISGYRTWGSVTNGDTVLTTVKSALDTFEHVYLTKSGGTTPVLARTTVRRQSDGTSNPVNWPTNTQVELYSSLGAEDAVASSIENVFTAGQHLNGNRVSFDTSQSSYLHSPADTEIQGVIEGAECLRLWLDGLIPSLRWYWADAGAAVGPLIDLFRNSSSPVAADLLGRLRFLGNDTGGNPTIYGDFAAYIVDPTNGTEDGGLFIRINRNGTLTDTVLFEGDRTIFFPGNITANIMVGKTTSGLSTTGCEIWGSGQGYFTTSASECLTLNRKTSDGAIINVCRDGTVQAVASIASGTMTWGAFTGNHISDWAPGEGGPEYEKVGTVVATAEGMLDIASDPCVLVRPASRGDRRVYGVVAERQMTNFGIHVDAEPRPLLTIFAVGNAWIRVTGPVLGGDLLWASAEPGLAEAQPNQDAAGPWTVAKATQDSPDDGGERLVPCVLMAGG